jgi:acetyl esterase/lipase
MKSNSESGPAIHSVREDLPRDHRRVPGNATVGELPGRLRIGGALCIVMKTLFLAAIVAGPLIGPAPAAETMHASIVRDIEYARVGDRPLKLDLYLPQGRIHPPLIVWVHGGAWRSGSKSSMPLGKLVDAGYAVASVDYRLSTEARFPAQIHDLKAAIRFLRAHSREWKVSPRKIAIAGDSAGAHLAALVGVSHGNADLEGTHGNHRTESSDVQGIISFYGAANLVTILNQSTPHGLSVRIPALELLLGDQPTNSPAVARLASPVFHVDRRDPPLLLLHGDQDPQMPINQSHELEAAYQKVKAPVQFVVVHGAAHGGAAFYDEERLALVKRFLQRSF